MVFGTGYLCTWVLRPSGLHTFGGPAEDVPPAQEMARTFKGQDFFDFARFKQGPGTSVESRRLGMQEMGLLAARSPVERLLGYVYNHI